MARQLAGPERKSFIEDWFKRCGAKGDLTGFLESKLQTCIQTTQRRQEGVFTPCDIARELRICLEFYKGDVEKFERAIRKELAGNQEAHGVPVTAWLECEDFFASKHRYARVHHTDDM
eukprot:6284914-Amphidinium_carterae.1